MNSFPLCTAFGQQFYMSGDGFGNIGSDSWAPAWLVPVVGASSLEPPSKKRRGEKVADAPEPLTLNNCILGVKSADFEFSYKWHLGVMEFEEQINYTIFALHFNGESGKQGLASLKRPIIAEQIKEVPPTISRKPPRPRASAPAQVF